MYRVLRFWQRRAIFAAESRRIFPSDVRLRLRGRRGFLMEDLNVGIALPSTVHRGEIFVAVAARALDSHEEPSRLLLGAAGESDARRFDQGGVTVAVHGDGGAL